MTAIEFNHVSKQYRLGLVSTKTLSHDIRRWWLTSIMRQEDPYLKIGETNDRATKGNSEYVWALRDIDFKVEQGDVVGIIGKNGAGKSTLLKLLSRVTGPTTGTIRAHGRIGSLLEVGTGFHSEMTGRENIYMNGAILGMTKAEIDSKLDEIIDFSGCERYIDTPVKRYSSGMTVRLGFAVAAFLEPEILVVDEVLAVGDAEFQKKAIGKMKDVSQGEGRTVLFVSHNMGSLKALCKKGVLLENGMKVFEGNIVETIQTYLHSDTNHTEPLLERTDHNGTGDVVVTSIDLIDEQGHVVAGVLSGQTFYVRLNYRSRDNKAYEHLNVSISVTDENLAPLFLLHSRMLGHTDVTCKGDGHCDFKIEGLNLNKGQYNISYSIMAHNGKGNFLDGLSNAIVLNVQGGDFYKTGELAPREFGPLLMPATFSWV